MRAFLGSLLPGLAVACLLYLGLSAGCPRRDPGGQRADSVLATDSTYRRDTLRQDSTLTALTGALDSLDREADRWRDSARVLTRQARRQVQRAEAVDSSAPLVPGLAPHDSIIRLMSSRNLWRGAALHYSQRVVPTLQRQLASDSIWKLTALAQADTLESQRDYARSRANDLTREFRAYRSARKPGLDLGLFRLSDGAQKVIIAVGSGYAGCKIGGGC